VADVVVTGADKLHALAAAMKTVDKPLRAEMRRALRTGVKPGVSAARARAVATLPHSGGLGTLVSKSRIFTIIKSSSKVTHLRVTSRTRDPRIDRGEVRHPTHGHRDRWVVQRVPRGWFTEPMRQNAPAIRRELLVSMDRMTARLRSAAR
jgi:hypothetical protein